MKINFNAPFWTFLKSAKNYFLLILLLFAMICVVSITIVRGVDNNEAFQERVLQEHSSTWKTEGK